MRTLPFLLIMAGCAPGGVLLDDGGIDTGPTGDGDPAEPTGDDGEPCTPQAAIEGAALDDGLSGRLQPCEGALHALAGPRGALVDVNLEVWSGAQPAALEVRTVGGELLYSEALTEGGALTLELPWSGEFLVALRGTETTPADWSLRPVCRDGCDALWTRYPVMLMHGMAGTDQFIGLLDYWYGLDDDLSPRGMELVIGTVDPFQTTPIRAAEWADQLDALMAEGRHRRVNLVGHSQGGLDARYVASLLDPDERVASVSTIGTPHRGVVVSDASAGLLADARLTRAVLDAAFDGLAVFYGLDSDQDIAGQLAQFQTSTMAAFNAEVLDRSDVVYASWAGVTCAATQLRCQRDRGFEVVSPLFATQYRVTDWFEGDNDGLVSVDSARWGTFLGTIPADHADEVGQIGGLTAPGFDHLAFYRDHMAWLAAQGL